MLITLTTDFGHDDPFVAIMKGVILNRCPQATLIDICHTIAPQDIATASQMLIEATPYFPDSTIHVAVIDPGVGTSRRIICLETGNQFFLGPDNGLLTPFFNEAQTAFLVDNDKLFLHPVSATFHGRDIFAPVAAALANGLAAQELGPQIPVNSLRHLDYPKPTIKGQQLLGQCLRADHFGNMSTNIHKTDLTTFLTGEDVPYILIGHTTISGLSPTYGKQSPKPLALINSSNHLEISISGGNATKLLNLKPGTPVIIIKNQVT